MSSKDQVNYIPSIQEETLNSVTHAIGLGFSIAALYFSIIKAIELEALHHIISFSIYGSTLIILFAASTIYHAITYAPLKLIFQLIDHMSIYILIAGTYTPYCLALPDRKFGITLLLTIWTLSIIGITFKFILKFKFPMISTVFYLLLSWVGILGIHKLYNMLGLTGSIITVLGGIFYSSGVIFFVQQVKYAHTIWHIFVLLGTFTIFIALYFYVLM